MLLLSAIADSSYLYSGMAETLYEYAFDTILPKYTPEFDEIIAPKNLITEQESLEINSDLFEIYPNPTPDHVNVRLNADVYTEDVKEYFSNYGIKYGTECLKLDINLYDINSRLLESKNYYIDEEININLKDYISGTYIIEIKNCFDKVVVRKIVKI
ncbi:MAG: T9SS type A sorting domain-containing protein [Bacteroidales bacterium]|nr:T9SS type A sorting domain-containing protein [Bacteroidales bacterium]